MDKAKRGETHHDRVRLRAARRCSRNIHVAVSDDAQTVEHIEFTGGCNGNLKAISKLVEGQPVQQIVDLLAGNTCVRAQHLVPTK